MNARVVNVANLLLLVLELASGLGSFLSGEPDGRWLFWLHRAGGLALVVLLARKAMIATRSYRRRGLSGSTGLSAVAGILFLGSLLTGLLWAVGGWSASHQYRCWEAGPFSACTSRSRYS